ncbi:unnamed protein product [Cylindrotheca closterium]|uniref:Uncharacterized protein n=1 Tax=Cylindrotheca closterium TaxID=2856 RepID=A0AAD2CFI0_9STRA|nr:unnamed protein product [Cylindrotheca closterium]
MPGTKKYKDSEQQELPQWLHDYRKPTILKYDTSIYPFRQLVADWLGVPSDQLETIHLLPLPEASKVNPRICQAWKAAKMPRLTREARIMDAQTQRQVFQSDAYHKLMETYRLFVKEVIAPDCGDQNIVYQAPPTTRVVLPNGRSTISMHSDKEYSGHQAAEINFWLPLTKVGGTNSLWLESAPGKGDFEPIELEYGQFLKFNGYDCRHYTVDNETDQCRVSFDFRVTPSELCLQRKQCGEFCVEETTSEGYIAYPHKFWKITRNMTHGEEEGLDPIEYILPSEDKAKYMSTLKS